MLTMLKFRITTMHEHTASVPSPSLSPPPPSHVHIHTTHLIFNVCTKARTLHIMNILRALCRLSHPRMCAERIFRWPVHLCLSSLAFRFFRSFSHVFLLHSSSFHSFYIPTYCRWSACFFRVSIFRSQFGQSSRNNFSCICRINMTKSRSRS